MTHVLHIGAGNLYGGVESLLVTFARERARCPDMTPHFATCFPGRLHDALAATGAPVTLLPSPRLGRPWTVWRARRALRDVLIRDRPEVAICHGAWTHALFAPTLRAARVPLIFWQHGPASGHWLERWASRTTPDAAVATSQFTAGSLAGLFPSTPVAVIHPAVSPPTPVSGAGRTQLRAALGAAPNDVVIVQVARMESWKGHAVLLDALGRLRAAPSWRAWIVGGAQRPAERQYLGELERAAARLDGRVTFLGERSDVPTVLDASDIAVQPNVAPEPFGIAIVEALYAGLPVVTSAMGGAAEIVDPSCGVLVPGRDAPALAATLQRLLDDAGTRRRLGAAGPARAAAVSDPARQLGRLASVAQSLAGARLP